MTLPVLALNTLRAKVLLIAVASAVLPTARAAATNHDLQAIRIPPVVQMLHDRAPGPVGR